MTLEEIRQAQRALIGNTSLAERVASDKYLDLFKPMIGLEIAAQLAELNATLKSFGLGGGDELAVRATCGKIGE